MNRRASNNFIIKVKDYLQNQGYDVDAKTKLNSVFHFISGQIAVYVKENGVINVNERNAILSEAEHHELIPYIAFKNAKGEIELKEVR